VVVPGSGGEGAGSEGWLHGEPLPAAEGITELHHHGEEGPWCPIADLTLQSEVAADLQEVDLRAASE
jgi:hypothetical protein